MGSAIAPPFNNSRRLRWAAARAASVQICSTLPQSAGGAPNFTGFARRRDPLLRPVAPGCARLRPLRPVAPGCARLRPLRPVAPGCARLRPVVPSSAVPHHPTPSRTILHRPAPSCTVPHRRTRSLSRRSPVAPQRHRTPAPSHSCTVTPRPFASSLSSPLPFVITAPCSPTHPHPDPDEPETSHQNKNFAFFRSIFRLLAFSDSGSLPERHQRDQCGPEEEVWTLFARLHAIARLLKCRLLLTIATFEEK